MLFSSPRRAAVITAAALLSSPVATPSHLFFLAAAFSVLALLKTSLSPRLRPPLPPANMRPGRTSPPPPLAFSSPESLSQWLAPRLPANALASWGAVSGTKSVRNLWLELSQGESSLLPAAAAPPPPLPVHQAAPADASSTSAAPPVRAVHVTIVRIRNSRGALLVESHQLLSDGAVRERNRPLSEKMRPGESVEAAATRAVREELGGDVAVEILPGSYDTRVEDRESASYPGLLARYVLHSVDARLVEGVPEEGEFSTEEAGECFEAKENAVVVKRHFWRWVDDDGSISDAGS